MSVEQKVDSSRVLSTWSGLFQKPIAERQSLLRKHLEESGHDEAAKECEVLLNSGGLRPEIANAMVENCIGVLGMPIGVMPNLILNGKHFVVPMSVEEPSVIAAAASACKLIASHGGFMGTSMGNVMVGQLQLLDLDAAKGGAKAVKELIDSKKKDLVAAANEHCKSMLKRGGGVTDIEVRTIEPADGRKPYLILHIKINVCEAMGANIVNTVSEGLAPHVKDLVCTLWPDSGDSQALGPRVGLKILTNLCLERTSCVTFRIPVKDMAWKAFDGVVVSNRVLEAYYLAVDDKFRATTHNKGTMNGIDAVAIATGQDWRAIEAAAHAYASLSGSYQPMTAYSIEDDHFVGRLEIPISVGTVGGALQTHPTYKLIHKVLGNPNSQTLCQIILAVGLAQNFAAMRALAIEGIQKGHMALHARNVALSSGVPLTSLSQCVSFMTKNKQISKHGAEAFLATIQRSAI